MSILLTPEVIILFIEDLLLLIFNTIAVFVAYKIKNNFNLNKTTQEQYNLEKQTYLASYIIRFSLYLKIISAVFFIYTLDKFAAIIPGAMCAVGAISSSGFGLPLIILKLFNIYLYGVWLVLDKQDTNREDYPFTRIKFKYFILIYFFFITELLLQYLYFFDINPQELVSCCATVFNEQSITFVGRLINMPSTISLPLFYFIFVLLVYSSLKKQVILNGVLNLFYLIISIITLIGFFGTYIYELPTHHCPFCLLQNDYYFVGYFLYAFLILGTFFGIANAVFKSTLNISLEYCNKSLLFNLLYFLLVSFYPVYYYLTNGVWL